MRMKATTSRAEARAALLKAQAAAAEERKRREIANVGDLTTFVVETAELDGVDEWEAERLAKVRATAQARRDRHRVSAGRALQAMRSSGESITAIAAQAGVSAATVRVFLQAAENDAPTSGSSHGDSGGRAGVAAPATNGAAPAAGRDRAGVAADAS